MAEWWHELPLVALDSTQWERLCDGCGKCCLHKLADEDSGELYYTRVSCRYLDDSSGRCRDYRRRLLLVPDCIRLTPDMAEDFDWLPATCAYRLRARGERLPDWHPLLSGDSESVHRAGASVRGRTLSEQFVHPDGLDEHIVTWID